MPSDVRFRNAVSESSRNAAAPSVITSSLRMRISPAVNCSSVTPPISTGLANPLQTTMAMFTSKTLTANDVTSIVVGSACRTGRKARRSCASAKTMATTTVQMIRSGQTEASRNHVVKINIA